MTMREATQTGSEAYMWFDEAGSWYFRPDGLYSVSENAIGVVTDFGSKIEGSVRADGKNVFHGEFSSVDEAKNEIESRTLREIANRRQAKRETVTQITEDEYRAVLAMRKNSGNLTETTSAGNTYEAAPKDDGFFFVYVTDSEGYHVTQGLVPAVSAQAAIDYMVLLVEHGRLASNKKNTFKITQDEYRAVLALRKKHSFFSYPEMLEEALQRVEIGSYEDKIETRDTTYYWMEDSENGYGEGPFVYTVTSDGFEDIVEGDDARELWDEAESLG